MDVSYPWSEIWGLLTVIQGAVKYLEDTTLVYIELAKPPHQNGLLTYANQSATQVRMLTKENNLLTRDYTVLRVSWREYVTTSARR